MDNSLIDKLKKALMEMLFLAFLEKEARPILEIRDLLDEKSSGICKIQFPYAIVYRMVDAGYIREIGKAKTETRKKNYIEITDEGKKYLTELKKEYNEFISGVTMILDYLSNDSKE
jgi:PadR family transcriptional regulator PadR